MAARGPQQRRLAETPSPGHAPASRVTGNQPQWGQTAAAPHSILAARLCTGDSAHPHPEASVVQEQAVGRRHWKPCERRRNHSTSPFQNTLPPSYVFPTALFRTQTGNVPIERSAGVLQFAGRRRGDLRGKGPLGALRVQNGQTHSLGKAEEGHLLRQCSLQREGGRQCEVSGRPGRGGL